MSKKKIIVLIVVIMAVFGLIVFFLPKTKSTYIKGRGTTMNCECFGFTKNYFGSGIGDGYSRCFGWIYNCQKSNNSRKKCVTDDDCQGVDLCISGVCLNLNVLN